MAHTTPPLVLWEDAHLLAIHKPAGVNTHKPDRFAQDGIYEWLKKQNSDWRTLSIIHRLDKETSGVMVFGKTPLANKSLTEQFEKGRVRKKYLFVADACGVDSSKTISAPIDGKAARTEFRVAERLGDCTLMEARPATGRTHQVRIHAAEAGCPVAGDGQYGLSKRDFPRLMLHAWQLELVHPQSGRRMTFEAPEPKVFRRCKGHYPEYTHLDQWNCALEMRELLFDARQTDACRLISGTADGFPDVNVDRFGELTLVQKLAADAKVPDQVKEIPNVKAILVQEMQRARRTKPQVLHGTIAENTTFRARENGVTFLLRAAQGFSPGLFLDQRENRRRLREIAKGKEVLNCFAYTCSFSVAAAMGGGKTTSLDLSKGYLEWGRENFRANDLDPDEHDFIYGEVFDWLKRFGKRGRQWDIVLLDPPTFATDKRGRVFRASKEYRALVRLAARLVKKGGILFCSTNQRSIEAPQFVSVVETPLREGRREPTPLAFETQPLDFRTAPHEKPYLKTVWHTLR